MLSLANINPNVTSITRINTLCLFLKLSVVSDYNQANLREKGLCVLCLLDEKGMLQRLTLGCFSNAVFAIP